MNNFQFQAPLNMGRNNINMGVMASEADGVNSYQPPQQQQQQQQQQFQQQIRLPVQQQHLNQQAPGNPVFVYDSHQQQQQHQDQSRQHPDRPPIMMSNNMVKAPFNMSQQPLPQQQQQQLPQRQQQEQQVQSAMPIPSHVQPGSDLMQSRISLLFDTNLELIDQAVKAPKDGQTIDGIYVACMKRLQCNLAYLAFLADKSKSLGGSSFPQILTAPEGVPSLEKNYAQLRQLFPEAGTF